MSTNTSYLSLPLSSWSRGWARSNQWYCPCKDVHTSNCANWAIVADWIDRKFGTSVHPCSCLDTSNSVGAPHHSLSYNTRISLRNNGADIHPQSQKTSSYWSTSDEGVEMPRSSINESLHSTLARHIGYCVATVSPRSRVVLTRSAS